MVFTTKYKSHITALKALFGSMTQDWILYQHLLHTVFVWQNGISLDNSPLDEIAQVSMRYKWLLAGLKAVNFIDSCN